MHVRGSLAQRTPADILEWIAREKKTGALRFFDPQRNIRKDIWVEHGVIVSSGSNDPREYLGQFLIASGRITEQDFVRAYRTQQETKVLLGKVLVMIGLVTEAEVGQALAEKTEEGILDTFLWSDGQFEFEDGATPLSAQRLPLTLDVPRLIANGETRQIEWGLIRQVFPTTDGSVVVDHARVKTLAALLDAREHRMITLAVAGKSLAEIALDQHLPEFAVLKKFYEFARRGLVTPPSGVRPVGSVQPTSDAPAPAARSVANAPMPPIAIPKYRQEGPGPERDIAGLVPTLAKPLSELTSMVLRPEEGFILSRIDGQLDVKSVLAICPFPEEAALGVLRSLGDRGIIQFGGGD